jgi:hypothetical protein
VKHLSLAEIQAPRNLSLRAGNTPFGIYVHPKSASARIYEDLERFGLVREIETPWPEVKTYQTTAEGCKLINEPLAVEEQEEPDTIVPLLAAITAQKSPAPVLTA